MGKNKLKKFAEMEMMPNVVQCPRQTLLDNGFQYKGCWGSDFFKSPLPLTLELGCGKGEYAVALAKANPENAYIGIDIKGARMHTGASIALREEIRNVAFLRTEIELLEAFFAPEEVNEIWITFPDPQMKKVNKRLTSARFLEAYRHLLVDDGIVNLKTDSPFLYEFTRRIVDINNLPLLRITDNLYATPSDECVDFAKAKGAELTEADPVTSIKTHYEAQWLSRGKAIKLLSFRLPKDAPAIFNPQEDDIEEDDYRAVPRFDPNQQS